MTGEGQAWIGVAKSHEFVGAGLRSWPWQAEASRRRAIRRPACSLGAKRRGAPAPAEGQAWLGVAKSHEVVGAGLCAMLDKLLLPPCAAQLQFSESLISCGDLDGIKDRVLLQHKSMSNVIELESVFLSDTKACTARHGLDLASIRRKDPRPERPLGCNCIATFRGTSNVAGGGKSSFEPYYAEFAGRRRTPDELSIA